MDVREKLVGLLWEYDQMRMMRMSIEECVDRLISKGVTAQECKVGDTIYEVDGEHGIVKHEVYEVCVVFKTTATDDKGNEWDDYWTSEDIGNAFKTRNEAEANLPQPPKEDAL